MKEGEVKEDEVKEDEVKEDEVKEDEVKKEVIKPNTDEAHKAPQADGPDDIPKEEAAQGRSSTQEMCMALGDKARKADEMSKEQTRSTQKEDASRAGNVGMEAPIPIQK